MPNQWPAIGATLELTFRQDDLPAMEVTLTECLGAARIYRARNAEGEEGLLICQPSGTYYILRDFEEPEGDPEPWQGDGSV